MFKRKKTTVKNTSESHAPDITYIAKSTQINADIECKHDLRISGTIEGETKAQKKVILTNSGSVKGSIYSPNVDISGKVTGDIRASESLNLRATAVINGKIFTKKLTIENGAQVKGSFNVGPDVKIDKLTDKPLHTSETKDPKKKEAEPKK